ncbi:MAG: HlyD family efflux transporter periplasmic adaptor subunit [Hoeflea sp.]|uniref:efflux RND transporter periplasmic adaptor subunit n=1 Tax=Hoeflea sp. TaxID=1940281 RepID=UPI001DDE6386|nr:HlyD family efflux transporter periplasmic adaptor subunit [Hoeflea sp.]MBU4527810.1 HlyD family efflux transporter periplasmic adaptor subunit [Alphaproteobacteria bacterium]MBU4546155.1 HlyD family efflux transporter periplasmic adaptor subunit [Alphaproteobacteria bacterium]MBU4553160.1 HlyD family efflux transporter periplasmic adaptor subunit [Alphaproteobacteria bacterium]MBV1724232.1 HlyD family efflux transporter periplasmic adaptor subunit [Hoeflea sp.]MBV1759917.1 HlyD family effl
MASVLVRSLAGLAAAAVIGGAFFVAFGEKSILVDLATVTTAPMQVTVKEDGVTRIRNVYAVSSPIAGHLDRIEFSVGDPIGEGESIAEIHPLDPPFLDTRTRTELMAGIDAARSSVAVAEVELIRARTGRNLVRASHTRAMKLAATNFISESELERLAGEVELAEAQVTSAEAMIALRRAELASAEARLAQPGQTRITATNGECCVEIVSPIAGTILALNAKSEQAVSVGQMIAEVGEPSDLEITVDLLSADAVKVRPGSPALVTDWGGTEELQAQVERIEPSAFTKVSALGISEQRVNAIIALTEPPPEDLGHGFRVIVNLITWASDAVLQVPVSALYRDQGDWAVFRMEDGRARVTRVEIGHMTDRHAEILSGLSDGDRVVLYPGDALEDGSLIEDRAAAE